MSTTVFVYTMNRAGEVGAWSRYEFPFQVDTFTQMGDGLYIRAGDDVLLVDEKADMDFDGDVRAQPFAGVVQWPWLDFGQPGQNKQLIGVDIATINANSASVQLEVGYDQSNKTSFTSPYDIPSDSVPGTIIPLPVMAASMSFRLTFSSYDFWQFQSMTVYVNDMRITS